MLNVDSLAHRQLSNIFKIADEINETNYYLDFELSPLYHMISYL